MEIGETKYFTDRKQWRNWLQDNFESEKEIWLIYPHKSSGKKRIPYNDAVEEALCFGWIDSIIKSYDESSSVQRYSPRKKRSNWSQPNKERLKWLDANNLLHSSVKEATRHIIEEEYVFPADILSELKKDKTVWENYQKFTDGYKRIRIAYIDDSRIRPDYFKKRLDNFIKHTRQNKLIPGFGGIDKYY